RKDAVVGPKVADRCARRRYGRRGGRGARARSRRGRARCFRLNEKRPTARRDFGRRTFWKGDHFVVAGFLHLPFGAQIGKLQRLRATDKRSVHTGGELNAERLALSGNQG